MTGFSRILIVGASYGSLMAAKAAMAGVAVTLVGHQSEVDAINSKGVHVKIHGRRLGTVFDLHSKLMLGSIAGCIPRDAEPSCYDLVIFAMQEPQYVQPDVRGLMMKASAAGKPCLSIMNMPPPPFLRRFPDFDNIDLNGCYSDLSVWDGFEPQLFTHTSPDPQAYRPPGSSENFLRVGLPANFRTAQFDDVPSNTKLCEFASSINDARWSQGGRLSSVPVRLKVSRSPYVPFSKWSMLLAGNYRCIQAGGPRSIKNAVHDDLAATRRVYDWVNNIIMAFGAEPSDTIPFEQYAKAAFSLVNPSSAARALFNGATAIERVDRLVQTLARHQGFDTSPIDAIVAMVDDRLKVNRCAK